MAGQNKIIVILGPTAVGKSAFAVKLAQKFNGEVISADSRQVYKGLDIGSGKVPRDKAKSYKLKAKSYLYKGIPHHLLDVASPKRIFTVAQYQKLAQKAINNIFKKNKVPIICGGTGFYIDALIYGCKFPEVAPQPKLRKQLEQKSTEELFKLLKKLDPKRAKTIEKKNPRRLIRAIEIATKIGRIPILSKKSFPYPVLMFGIKKEKEELKKLIKKRFFKWLKQGFLKEVLKLKKSGLSWQRIEDFGIHYKTAAQYLKKEISDKEFIEKSLIGLQNYSKRQMTWFKKDKNIHWLKNPAQAYSLVKSFLQKGHLRRRIKTTQI